ncbi:DedA family protein [Micromonospora pisi]|uniref:DedA family protein n=1 Tax=Micromonospora pisi TaxID=589240 RepID=UPI001B87D049|nr:DedA family protein [Micromonospora pisi]
MAGRDPPPARGDASGLTHPAEGRDADTRRSAVAPGRRRSDPPAVRRRLIGLRVDTFTGILSGLSGWPLLVLVGVLAFGECAAFIGLILPGETALLLGGALASTGRTNIAALVIVAAVCAIIGDSVGYEIGRRVGMPLRRSRLGRWVGEERWQRAETFIERHGPAAVMLGRWVGVLRALVPALAGMTRMPYPRFLLFNVIGGVTWATAVVLIGYALGASWQRAQDYLGQASVALAAAVVLTLIVRWVIVRRRRRRQH